MLPGYTVFKILCYRHAVLLKVQIDGDDARNFEPKKWLKFKDIDKSMQELRVMFKQNPHWFEVPKPKSDKGQNMVDYSIK